MTYSSLESEYLVTLLRCAIKQEKPPKAPEGMDWKELAKLSKKQQVYAVIVPIIDLTSVPAEVAEELQLYSQNELIRMLAMKTELEEIEKDLEVSGIKFMLLKGSVIRDYYPLQKMRQMSDFDILYDYSKRDSLIEIMSGRGYNLYSCGENSDDFSKKPFYTFEFHRDLFFNEHTFYPDFSDVWDNAQPDSKKPYMYHMSDEDLYLHTVAHMYKHYILGGFGIRFLADIYVLLEHFGKTFDRKYVDFKLEKMNLTSFEEEVRELSYSVFDGTDFTKKQIAFLNDVMSFGIYGSGQGGAKVYYDEYVTKSGKTGIAGYYMSKIFPNRKFMMQVYPILEKKPYLLLFYYVKRLFHKFIYSRKFIFNSIKSLKKEIKEENDKK
ncbi:MAG: nucleotidyltransferase family protein [Eubacterium sp.]